MDHPRRTAHRREPAAHRARRRVGHLPGWVAGAAGAFALRVANRAVGAALLGAVLVSGVAQVQDGRAGAARVAAAVAETRSHTAERVEARRVERVTHAATARLTGEAVRYAAVRRAEALAAARTAVQAAQAVVVSTSASPDVPTETVTPLGEATARLTALIEATPDVPLVPTRPTRVAAGTVRSLAAGTATVSGRRAVPAVDAGAQLVDDVVTPTLSGGGAGAGAGAGATPAAAEPTTTPAARTGGDAAVVTAPTAAAAAPAAAPAAAGTADVAATSGSAAPSTATATPGGSVDPVTAETAGDPHLVAGIPEVADETLQVLDLAVSAEVLAAARQLTELSVQAQASADAAVAAAQAARAAAEEAARAQAAALADRVAAADAAPNGQIPTELLCSVEVAPDALLRCDAAAALDRLAAAYRADLGRRLDVVSSYRSFDAQVAVKATRGELAATPGRSNHGRALAVDLGGFGGVGDFTAPSYLWMQDHAAEFGWHHPAAMEPGGSAPQEPWHWEFDTED